MKIFGHRGARGLAPENTLESFKKALEYGVDAIELDVHKTKDDILVCSHDPTIVAKGGKWYSIPRCTYAELLRRKSDLVTLEQVIEYVNRKVPIIIEIKEGTPGESVAACIQKFLNRGWQMSDFEFCSFIQAPLTILRKAFPDAELIPNEEWSSVKACWRARKLGTRRISMKARWLWQGYLRMMQNRGWKVSSYTINNVKLARRWEPYLYAVYTDYPDRFQK